MPNREKTRARVSAAVAVLAVGLIFLPGWIHLEGMRGGYALSFVALCVAISAAVVTWFFWGRAVILDRMLTGSNVLAHWTYGPAEWKRYVDSEMNEQTRENRWLLLVVAGWALLFGVLFWVLDREAGWIVFLVMLGLILLLSAVAHGFPRLWYRRQRRGPGEVWIAPAAMYLNGTFVRWNSWGMRLEKVTWLEPRGSMPARLGFDLSYVAGWAGRQSRTLRVPVPQGREAEACSVLNHFVHRNK